MTRKAEEVSHDLANELQAMDIPAAKASAMLLDAGFLTSYQKGSNAARDAGLKHSDFMFAALKMMGGLVGVQATYSPYPSLALALMLSEFERCAESAMEFTMEGKK